MLTGAKGNMQNLVIYQTMASLSLLKREMRKMRKIKKPEASEAAATVEKPTADIDSEGEEIENSMQDFLIQKQILPQMSTSTTHMGSWHIL